MTSIVRTSTQGQPVQQSALVSDAPSSPLITFAEDGASPDQVQVLVAVQKLAALAINNEDLYSRLATNPLAMTEEDTTHLKRYVHEVNRAVAELSAPLNRVRRQLFSLKPKQSKNENTEA